MHLTADWVASHAYSFGQVILACMDADAIFGIAKVSWSGKIW
jgi:hypothetical protein